MVQVRVSDGILEGETITNEIAGTYCSFKGIPYAAPPVGDLRFKAPQPPTPWEGVRSAKEFGNVCPQFNFITETYVTGSEDCLYLNVYTPNMEPAQPMPVMIWIHGGGFCCGSGDDDIYGPDFLIRNGVVLVTINYRLEILGFLCLDTEDIPGNAGIKDQVAAMRWVQKNISKFGGDPDNVTIFGQSAGGASVTYHCVSPMTKGLFKRAIAQSGCAFNWWAQIFKPRERALALAKHLGCKSSNDKELYDFFKTQPVETMQVFSQIPIYVAEKENDKYEIIFSIASETVFPNVETFFTGDITEALKNNIHEGVELLLGYNEDDGTINLAIIYDIDRTIFQANNVTEYFIPKPFRLYCSVDDQLKIGEAAKRFYLRNKFLTVKKLDPLTKFYGLDMCKYGIWQLAKYYSVQNKVFFYKFKCKSERNFFSKIYLSNKCLMQDNLMGHNDELPYLFPVKRFKQEVGLASPTFKLIDTVSKLWTNFAKTGTPTPDLSLGINWRMYNAQTQNYLEIGNTLVRNTKPDKEEQEFWDEIFRQYLPRQMYNGLAKHMPYHNGTQPQTLVLVQTGNSTPDTCLGTNWRQFKAETQNYLEIPWSDIPYQTGKSNSSGKTFLRSTYHGCNSTKTL